MLQNYVFAFGPLQEKVRGAAPPRLILAQKSQRRYVGLGLKMRETLVSVLGQSGLSVGSRF